MEKVLNKKDVDLRAHQEVPHIPAGPNVTLSVVDET